ncbi:3-oxoacyl-ACP reductase [Pokkaliibacter plantistimulans]|uniref:3-oxoacyl-ACP reductase n=1 Tax=Proteobacteria bacterium 228 TaxID=2083153 RepID=A0A2S5KPW1_9PROT|nr:SDR family oxidoreductase [Pokkaliibacter plantistimulans]PPC76887.1 3-oxoacyl-ACP reductase [Pokkaliibacter plantistimulans]
MTTLTNRYPSLSGQQVFISGGASGIGEHLVMAFCAQGARVAFIDIDELSAEALVTRAAQETGIKPWFAPCDVRDISRLQQCISEATTAMGGLTVLINNAAKDDRHDVDEVTPEYWDNCQNINLRHHFFAMQQAARLMKDKGSIINMGSIGWLRGRPGIVGYTTAKGAIHAMTRTMARELGPQGIRVNSVLPGAVVTERQKALWLNPDIDQQFLDLQALKFRIQPDDIAAMVLFLASDDSRACAGQSFVVDCGIV